MIKRIQISDVASYDRKGVVFEKLAKVNIVYGGNGTGKTTISRLLAGSEGTDGENPFKNCKVEWKGKALDVMVYNQDFKKRNLMEDMPGIFTLGEDYAKLLMESAHLNRRKRELEKQGFDKDTASKMVEDEQEKALKESTFITMQPTIERINGALKMLGFKGFSIQASTKDPFFFQIQREDGKLVEETLSEGEVTIITFLYFMQVVYGGGKDDSSVSPKVVVIDDPISSLDSDAMFVVSEMMRQMIDSVRGRQEKLLRKPNFSMTIDPIGGMGLSMDWQRRGVRQVIVLTHNVYFHRLLCYGTGNEEINHWMLKKQDGWSRLTAYEEKNPIADDYVMQWRLVSEIQKEIDNGGCPNVVGLPNAMRQILERYFTVYGGLKRSELIPKGFSDNAAEMMVARSLMKWTDEGSHGKGDSLYGGHSMVLAERYLKVFKKLFEKLGHGAHYEMMMKRDKEETCFEKQGTKTKK